MSPTETNTPSKPKAYNDHNVYILGAGFAAEAGMPVIRDFMNRMRDAAAWLQGQSGRDREIAAIENVLDFRLKAAAAAYRVPLDVEDVEQLFSLASATQGEELAQDMSLAIAATLDFAHQNNAERQAKLAPEYRFYQVGTLDQPSWSKPSNWEAPLRHIEESLKAHQIKGDWYSCPPYEFYAGIIGGYFNPPTTDRQDTIVTLNYDLTIETALYGLKIPFSYGLSGKSVNFGPGTNSPFLSEEYAPRGSLRLLKLHGSVNWAFPGEVGQKLTLYRDYDEVRQKVLVPLIVPPTWRKHLGGQLSDVWEEAVKALRVATRIIIIGYSIPPTDVHFKYLLAAGLQENISLRKVLFVNPDLSAPEIGDRLPLQLFNVLGQEHLGRGLIELIPEKTSAFFHGPKDTSMQPLYRQFIARPLPAIYSVPAPYVTFPPYF